MTAKTTKNRVETHDGGEETHKGRRRRLDTIEVFCVICTLYRARFSTPELLSEEAMGGPDMASHRVPLPAFSHLTHISFFSFSSPSPRSPWSSSSGLLSPGFQVIWRSIAQILGRVRFTAAFRLGIIGGLELMVSV
ncbi:hypothetical protein FCV25MIE_29614 [Fagus crenata]